MHNNQTSETTVDESQVPDATDNQPSLRADSSRQSSLSRRGFLGGVSGVTAATLAGGLIGSQPWLKTLSAEVQANDLGPLNPTQRRNQAFRTRFDAALAQRNLPVPDHVTNGDEERYPNKIGTYSKGLPHNSLGEVDLRAYNELTHALSTGNPDDFELITLGSPDSDRRRKLVDPQSGLAFDMEGTDSHQLAIPPAPALDSAEEAGEMVELYWHALLRDVPFTEYNDHPLAHAAATELSRLSDFRGPKVGGQVTPQTLFRGFTPGDVVGPYISQFLLRGTPFGAEYVERRMRTVMPGIDYMTQYDEWLEIQNGLTPRQSPQFDLVRRYIRNGRDISQWVHVDVLFQAYFNACLILLAPPDPTDDVTGGGIGAPLNGGNPYNRSLTQEGFGTFGGPHIATILCEVATRALKAQWFQKWFVHRRLRPEEYGGLVHNRVVHNENYPIHQDVLNSQALSQIHSRYGAYLLPMVFPEGCPLHPAYGAGHATVAGACVTVLKALFDESYVIPNPVAPNADGTTLVAYNGSDADRLTVGGELNKLASNIALGRNIAGVHWRSDYTASLRLGEAITISVLKDQRGCYNENFSGFTFTTFDGKTITV
jgi:hypothetical protein